MDVHSYVLDQDVPHWAKGVPLIQVVTPAPPDMNTFLDEQGNQEGTHFASYLM